MNCTTDYLTPAEVALLGLRCSRGNVSISRHAILINPHWITVEAHARIDAFAVLSAGVGGLAIGRYVHVGSGAKIYGSGGCVVLGDFAGMSPNSTIFTANDDWTDGHLMHPTVPDAVRMVQCGNVTLEAFAAIGCASVVLPGVTLHEGAAAGALTVVRRSVVAGEIVSGNPAKVLGRRDVQRMRDLAAQLQGAT